MTNIINILSMTMSDAFKRAGYDSSYGNVRFSDRPDLCDFQCNDAMAASKQYKVNPRLIATNVVNALSDEHDFTVSIAGPGFINISLNDSYLSDFVNNMSNDERCGIEQTKSPKTIIIDYGGPNVAKPLHVGHLRSAIIGESVKRIARYMGNKVIGDVHIGDWGLQMGLVISELQERYPDLSYFKEDFSDESTTELPIKAEDLYDIYPFASAKSKTDEAFMAKAQLTTKLLQEHKPGYYALWQSIMKISLKDMKANYKELSVDFDIWLGESDADKYVPQIVDMFIEKGYAYENQGALVIDVEEENDTAPMPPVLIKKSNGAMLYPTTDLATIFQRVQDYDPDEIWYLTDKRQQLHFQQVFRAAYKTGLADKNKLKMEHIYFGTMNGKDGKPFKTREGGVMRLSDLINMMHEAFIQKSRQPKLSTNDDELSGIETATLVGNAALKFGDLINHRVKDYIFDLDKFMSYDGKTGPYLLYSVVRMKSLLAKASDNISDCSINTPASNTERELMIMLLSYNNAFYQALSEKTPNTVCEILYNTASLFNKFYYETKVLSEENAVQRRSWLKLIYLTHNLMTIGLDLLGIDVPDKM